MFRRDLSPLLLAAMAAAEEPRWHGLAPSLTVAETSGVNAEPDAYANTLAVGLATEWAAGRLFGEGGYWEPLALSIDWTLVAELAGSDPVFRVADVDAARPAPAPLDAACYDAFRAGEPVGSGCVQRNVAGAGRRLDWSDVRLGAAHPRLWTVPRAEIDLLGRIDLHAPASRASTGAHKLVLALEPGVGLRRAFLGGRLWLSYGLALRRNFHRFATATLDDRGGEAEAGGTQVEPLHFDQPAHPARNQRWGLTQSFGAGARLPWRLAVSASYALAHAFRYDVGPCEVALPDGTVEDVCENTRAAGGGDADLPPTQTFALALDWAATGWLDTSLFLTTSTPARTPDSRGFYQPFFHADRNGFTSVGLSAAVRLADLYGEVSR